MKLKLADGVSTRRHATSTKFWRRLYLPHHATQATAVAELSTGRSETERALTLTHKRFAVRRSKLFSRAPDGENSFFYLTTKAVNAISH